MKRLFFLFIFLGSLGHADVPQLISFSGRLVTAAGGPVTSATSVVLRLFSQSTGGSALYAETQTVTPDQNGIYNVLIGGVTSLSGIDFNQNLFLEVEVAGETLSPRYRFTASPYAMVASTANAVAWANIIGKPAGFSDDTDDVGTLGANSVGEFHIINSTITDADIAPNAGIALAKLAKDPSVPGTINVSTNPVDWTQLKNVPAALADGVDDLGTVAANSIGNFHIIDSTITLSKLEKDPSQSGTINTSTNPVDWTQLKNVPVGLADGVDDLGTIGADSVGSFQIVDSTITNADIAPNAGIALSKLEKNPSVPGAINVSTNPVDWTQLKNVPAALADGVDDVGTIGADSVGSGHIINSTVTLADLDTTNVDGRYVTLGTNQAVSGTKTFSFVTASSATVSGALATQSGGFSAVNGNNNNSAIGNLSFVRIAGPTAAFSITGIAGGYDGRMLVLYNTTTFNMTIPNESANSTAANRIATLGTNSNTTGTGAVTLIYSGTDSRWIVLSRQP